MYPKVPAEAPFFVLYLNNFEKCLKYSKANIYYANDNSVTIASNDKEKLAEWMGMNKLSLNPSKTEYMIIGHPRKAKRQVCRGGGGRGPWSPTFPKSSDFRKF